jgi:hypothetical protein
MSKKHVATRTFTDAGTEKTHAEGEPIEAKAGEIANYVAAGLAAEAPAEAKTSGGKSA